MQQILLIGLTKISLKTWLLLTVTHLITDMKFKYIDIKDLINKIGNNTISEISAKKRFEYIKQNKKRRNNKTKKTHS